MAIHLRATCDAPDCGAAHGVGFESATETFGDMVAHLRGLGWSVETDGRSVGTRCLCPEHACGREEVT